ADTYGNYKKTGVAFYAYRTQVTGTVPVCSYYSQTYTDNAYSRGCGDAYGSYKKTRVEWYAFSGG
ncbi:MAG TPA: hypothetical protein VK963_02250, partial [Candidatus Saccharimonadales bacterium]|nr:hypothetical protein [Candidatus Saccharimonadales bacterium]